MAGRDSGATALCQASSQRRFELLGIPVWGESPQELLDVIRCSRRILAIHSLNAEILSQAQDLNELKSVLASNCLNIPDGFWVNWAVQMKYGRLYHGDRVAGVDLAEKLVEMCWREDERVCIVGGAPDVTARAVRALGLKYSGLSVSALSPERDEVDSEVRGVAGGAIQEFLRNERPAVVLVCLGAPLQELWVSKSASYLESIGVRVTLSAGGTVDFVAGTVSRAPVWIQQIGLEWLFRLVKEPRRFRRQVTRLPRFALRALLEITVHRLRQIAMWRR